MLFLLLTDSPDEASFLEELYHANYRLLYGQALLVLRSPEDAEDAVQTAMLRLCKKIPLLMELEGNKLTSYLVITVKHTAINLYHKRRGQMERQADTPLELVTESEQQGPEAQALAMDGVQRVKAAIQQLPPRERDALMLRYVQQLGDAQVAQAMGIEAVSARALLSRGRKRLAQILEEGEG